MIKRITQVFMFLSIGILSNAQSVPQLGKDPVEKIIKAMTLEEKASLLPGGGMSVTGNFNNGIIGVTQSIVPGAAGTTTSLAKYGIPATVVADGPAGLRISPTREKDSKTYYCTAFPVGTSLATTWNPELVEFVGKAIGNEVHEYGVDVLLAPALNIHRNPLCGRNFEYYSEDPLISGKIAAAYVKGVQSNGVGTCIKHFAVNNQETNRVANDARVSQRALREIYLRGFEIAVKESQPWTIMSSLNKINGIYAPENYDLLTTILRKEWGFEGIVMTDWFGGKDAVAQAHAGNDLLMPGRKSFGRLITEAVRKGQISEADVDRNATNILNYILNSPTFKRYKASNSPDLVAHAKITRQSATEGMVLLKNSLKTLPLTAKRIAVYGNTSYNFIAGGTGSGDVNRAYTVSLIEGLTNNHFQVDEELKKMYESYLENELKKRKKSTENNIEPDLSSEMPEEQLPGQQDLAQQTRNNDVAIITLGRLSGEFRDRIVPDFSLSDKEKQLIEVVCAAFHKQNKKVVVILNIGGVIETQSWKHLPDAILLAWQPGQEGGNSISDILAGKANPSGKLTMTFPVNYMDAASSSNFPYKTKMETTMVLDSKSSSGNEKNVDFTNYEEDIYVGYRYFDTFGKEVSYPFGFGLSYTEFNYSKATIKKLKGKYLVSVTVKNTGKVAGKEVVQLYVNAPGAGVNKPQKELKAFAKTKLLQPQEAQVLTMAIGMKELSSFNEKESAWVADAGKYNLLIGSSSRDIKQQMILNVPAKVTVEKVHDVMKPTVELKLLTPLVK